MTYSHGVERFLRQYEARPAYYREFAPAHDLRDVVACNWVNVVRHSEFGARTPIIPDGCSDIMLTTPMCRSSSGLTHACAGSICRTVV